VYITGSAPAGGAPDTVTFAVRSPAYFAASALRERLEEGGIPVSGAIRVIRDSLEAMSFAAPAGEVRRTIGHVVSGPMADIVAAILRPSQNWIAEHVLKTLGATFGGQGTWAAGLDVERRYLIDTAQIDSTAFFLRDASGLSVQNLLTPRAIVELLEHSQAAPWGHVFRQALPAPGMDESTLENRLPGFEERLRAKTGTITHVNSLAGFLTTDDRREVTFSIMTNASGTPSAAIRRGIDRIVEAIAKHGRRP
jgi:D-alanyl-D-alanine carboxypeptidase/D-alanyl-D-alanine-endopeptidase (penicillin-binding protein 4)